jgi:hypothetical protein
VREKDKERKKEKQGEGKREGVTSPTVEFISVTNFSPVSPVN